MNAPHRLLFRRRTAIVAGLMLSTAAVGAVGWGLIATPTRAQEDQSALAGLISRLISTPTTRVSIGGVEGALSSSAVITNVTISDEDGVWLSLDRAELDWSRAALLVGRLQVDALRLGTLTYARPSRAPATDADAAETGPLLPELPVEVRVDEFALQELVLGEPVLGVPARFSAEGSARIGDPSEGLTLAFSASRLDSPGSLSIDLGYAPATNRLGVDLSYDEPAGGVAARLLDLPGLPPVTLTLSGDDPLEDFTATLDFSAGETIGADGVARVVRAQAAYDLDLDLTARLEGLMPPAAAPVFRGDTRLTGAASVGDDSALRLDDLRLATPVAALSVSGALSAARDLDARIVARAVPGADGATRAGDVVIGTLAADLAVSGPIAAPRLNGDVSASGVATGAGRFENLSLRIASEPLGGQPNAERFSLAIDGSVDGLALTDADLGRAVGDSVEVAARGDVDLSGVASLSQARILTPTFAGNLTGRVGSDTLDAALSALVGDLAPFSGLVGSPLAGTAELDLRLVGDPSASRIVAQISGRLRDFASGSNALDGLLGREADLGGAVSRIPDGFAFNGLRLTGANLDLRVDGQADASAADIGLEVAIADLSQLDERIEAGALNGTVRVANTLAAPDASGELRVVGMRAMERDMSRLVVSFDATDVLGALSATASLDGDVAGAPATGSARVARAAGRGYALEDLALRIGSVSVSGRVDVDEDGLADGSLAIDAGDLGDVSPLLLTRLAGSLEGRVDLAARNGGQDVRLTASGAGLAYEDVAVSEFSADVTGSDVLRAPAVDGAVAASAIRVAGQEFTQARLEATGGGERTAFALSAAAQGFALAADGSLSPSAEGFDVTLATFSATRGSRRLALERPASFLVRDGGVVIDGLSLGVDGGRLALSGSVGEEIDLALSVGALPLAAAEIFAPGLALGGVAEGEARLSGRASAPTGDYRLTLSNVTAPQLRDAGIASVAVRASGALSNGRAGVDATISAAAAELRVTGSAPLDATGELDLRVAGGIDLAAANVFLAADGRRLNGAADIAATVRGMAASPRIDGSLTIRDAAYSDADLGFAIAGLSGRILADGDALRIESLRGTTPGGGDLSVGGSVRIDPSAGFPGDVRITGRRAQLIANDLATAVADLDVALTGPLASAPLISGRVVLTTLDVAVPDRLPTTLQPLPGTRHVAPPPQAQARLAILRAAERDRSRSAPFNARLDVTVIAANRVFVRGRGINAELGGDLRVTGTSLDPIAVGAFELRRGRLDILGQRLDFTRGLLTFSGDLTPELDFVAETQTSDAIARIAVSGPASDPVFILSASPELPQDEVLSRILFDRAAGGLSAAQALQLAQGVATLAGGGPGAFDQLRRALGVDSLDVTADVNSPAVGVSRYITDNVRVGLRAGARPEDTGVSVDIDLTRRLRLQSQVGADGSSSVGLGYEIEY